MSWSWSCRGVWGGALPLLLVLSWMQVGDAGPLFGLLDAFDTTGSLNGTSLAGALVAAHAQHTLAKLTALTQLAGLLANATETVFVG